MTTTQTRDTEFPAERPRVACSFGSTVGAPRARRGHLMEAGKMLTRTLPRNVNGARPPGVKNYSAEVIAKAIDGLPFIYSAEAKEFGGDSAVSEIVVRTVHLAQLHGEHDMTDDKVRNFLSILFPDLCIYGTWGCGYQGDCYDSYYLYQLT